MQADEDDPDSIVVGRPELGEFICLPVVCGQVIELLDGGACLASVRDTIAAEHAVELDLPEFVDALVDLGFVSQVDGNDLRDPASSTPTSHFPWLDARHVRWLFSGPVKLFWIVVVGTAVVTVGGSPELIPTYQHFFWSDYVGLSVLVNTAMFSVALSVHEMMHLAAARSLGAPARIGFGTRLHNLVVQTDVTAIWAVPRRSRYRVYLAGMAWDILLLSALLLVVGHADLPVLARALSQAFALTVLMSMPFQVQLYMRTDLYYVLRDLLRCRNLFDDGLGYARYLLTRAVSPMTRRRRSLTDPTIDLPRHERRAVRIYAVLLAVGSVVALSAFAIYGAPIVVATLVRALTATWSGLSGGPILPAVDAGLLLLVEGGIQLMFLITFARTHNHWIKRPRSSRPNISEANQPEPA